MALTPGRRLGPYEIVAPLGAGGMGEVFRARDTRLGRDVAVKVLSEVNGRDPGGLARFEREARTISSLNHPHICTLFDVGQDDGTVYLVMELVEGETLAARLARGPLGGAETVRLGIEIADALERAHAAGIVHRDLKPGNVMLTRSGAKLLDFGLARGSLGLGGAPGALSGTPTAAAPLTTAGTIVGTFQYMAPEQLEGREADARSDLWALGCLLYEAATGKPAFTGSSQASLVGAIMRDTPRPMTELVPLAPPGLDRVVSACLAKDPAERLQSAHDVKLQLQWVASGGSQAGVPVAVAVRRRGRERYAWVLVSLLGVLALVQAAPRLWTRDAPPRAMRLSLLPPEGANIDGDPAQTAISPDGGTIAFVATDSLGASLLWVRELSAAAARPLPGTEGAILPFWSPDSRTIGFFAEGKLKKVDEAGQNVEIVCDAPDGRGGSWGRRGIIVFAPASSGPLEQVPANGGQPTPATRLDRARGEQAHRFPSFLPDGRRFYYVVLASSTSFVTRLGSLDGEAGDSVVSASGAGVYAAPGYLIFARDGALLAQRLGSGGRRLVGSSVLLGSAPRGLSIYTGAPTASVSGTGVVVQRHRVPRLSQLAWLDRSGHLVGTVPTAAGEYASPALSPDGARVALTRESPESVRDVWVVDLEDGVPTRLTTDQVATERPVWSPDGRTIAFSALDGSERNIYTCLASGAGEPSLLLRLPGPFGEAAGWSPDGRVLFVRQLDPVTGEDIWTLPLAGERKPTPLLHSRYHEEDPSLSPDGRWLAYRSDESGRTELYVQSFPVPEAKYRISTDGAGTSQRSSSGEATWRRDGKELLYLAGDGVTLMSVPVETGATFHAGTPRRLFQVPPDCNAIAVRPDAQRFLVLQERSSKEATSIQLVLDWPALARQ